MRRERLTYRELVRRLLAGRLLRLEERRRAEEILAVPDVVEFARRLGVLLEGLADRGALLRLGRRSEDLRTVQRYLEPATNDTWIVEMPGPAAVHAGSPPPSPVAPSAVVPSTPPPSPAAASPVPSPDAGLAEAGAPPSAATATPRFAPPAGARAGAVSPAEEPVPAPRLVRAVEELVLEPRLAHRFVDASGEPQRTFFAGFAPCRTPEELADSLAPIRDQLVRCTTATDVRFHFFLDPQSGLTPIPLWGQRGEPHLTLGSRVADIALRERKALHVPNLAAPGADVPLSERGALASLPLVSGDRVVGLLEVRRDEAGPFAPDELELFALAAAVSGGSMARAEELEKLIYVDRLTGMMNRAFFDDQIEREIERANRMGTSLALLMVDVDHFKRINDRHGHLVGDHALAQVATLIRSNIRQIDVAARYGGEEFALLLPSITRARAARTAERLRRVVADAKFGDVIPELGDARLSISLGFALYPDDAGTAKQLIDRADRVALYTAKSRGRNRVVPWSASPEGPPVGTP